MRKDLFLLQEVETKIKIHLMEKRELDEKITLEDGKKLKEIFLLEIKKSITKYQLQINKIERRIKELDTNKNEIQKKIYGGVVSKVKELQALKTEDERIEKDIKELNNYANKLLVKLSEFEDSIVTVASEVKILRKDWDEKFPELKKRSDDLALIIQENKKSRDFLFKSIPDDLSIIYERLLKAKDNIAVSKVDSGSCSVCHVKFPLSIEGDLVSGKDIVFCDNCGRILVTV